MHVRLLIVSLTNCLLFREDTTNTGDHNARAGNEYGHEGGNTGNK